MYPKIRTSIIFEGYMTKAFDGTFKQCAYPPLLMIFSVFYWSLHLGQ